MSQHNTRVFLRHMLDHALEAVDMTQGKIRADLDIDRQFNLALERLLEITGEAASRISSQKYLKFSGPVILNSFIHMRSSLRVRISPNGQNGMLNQVQHDNLGF